MKASYTWVGVPLDTSLLNELTKKCMNNSKAVFAFPDICTIFSTALKFDRQSHCFARILAWIAGVFLGERKLLAYVCNDVAAIFDFITQ